MAQDTQPASQPLIRIPPTGNPRTQERFRRQSWWQVVFPVVVVSALSVAALVLLLVLGGPGGVSVVADYSLVLLVILALLGGLLVLALLGGLAYLITRLIGTIPPYTYAVQTTMQQVYEWVDRQTDRIAQAVITARSAMAGVEYYLRKQGIEPAAPDVQPGPDPTAGE
jgi:hypothetical protein